MFLTSNGSDEHTRGRAKQKRGELRQKLYTERIAIGYEQTRQLERLMEIRQELSELEEVSSDG
jgi:hypothetical protein